MDREKLCFACPASYPASYSSCPRCQLPLVFPTLSVTLTREWTMIAAALGLTGGLLGSLYPAVKAARLDPIHALNFE